jgi:hypothetical protein
LLPHDLQLDGSLLPGPVTEPTAGDIADLPARLRPHPALFRDLLGIAWIHLTREREEFFRALGILSNPDRAHRRMAAR